MGAQIDEVLEDIPDDFTDKFEGLETPAYLKNFWTGESEWKQKLSKGYEVFNPACQILNSPKDLDAPTEILLVGRAWHSPPNGGTGNWLGSSSQIAVKLRIKPKDSEKYEWTMPRYLRYQDGSNLHKDAEDPRLFYINDGSIVCMWNQPPPGWKPSYKGERKLWMYYSRVDVNGLEFDWGSGSKPCQANLDCQTNFEKNWMPFSLPASHANDGKGHDYIVHSLEPLTIYEFDWVKGEQVQKDDEFTQKDTHAFQLMRKYFNKANAMFSGGTPGILLRKFGGHYVEWLFVGHFYVNHSPAPGQYETPEKKKDFDGDWHQKYEKQYFAFYFTIALNTSKHQFFIARVSRGVGMPTAKYKPSKVIFPTGLVRLTPDKFLVTYGEADCHCRKYVITKKELDDKLQWSEAFARHENQLLLCPAHLPFSYMRWIPDPSHRFVIIMKSTKLVLNVEGTKLTVQDLAKGDHQAFHFKDATPGENKLSACTFRIAPAHTEKTGENKFVYYDNGGGYPANNEKKELKLVNSTGNKRVSILPQAGDGSVLIKSVTEDLFVTAEATNGGKVFMAKHGYVPGNVHQKFWLVPYGHINYEYGVLTTAAAEAAKAAGWV